MKAALLTALLLSPALAAAAPDLGGHEDPRTAQSQAAPVDRHRATLEEMWQRRLLPPDQSDWSPQDAELLAKIRGAEKDALLYFRRHGGERPWTAKSRAGGFFAPAKLTKEGYEKYVFLRSQDAVAYFESKGADAKRVFKLHDWDGKPLFDGGGLLTAAGSRVYQRARLNLEVFWKDPDQGDVYGTRRPPTKTP